jgi:uncharacterized membrane protein
MKFQETHARTIAKVITWRVALTTSHLINAWIVTGNWITGLQIAALATIINSVLFWAHERVWNQAQWRRHHLEYTFIDGHPRTISKIVTWRIAVSISNFVIPWIITGSWQSGLAFLTVATVVNMIIYWTHERVWNRVSWGKNIISESDTQH